MSTVFWTEVLDGQLTMSEADGVRPTDRTRETACMHTAATAQTYYICVNEESRNLPKAARRGREEKRRLRAPGLQLQTRNEVTEGLFVKGKDWRKETPPPSVCSG